MRGPRGGQRRPVGQAVAVAVVFLVLVHCHVALAPPPHRRHRRDVITDALVSSPPGTDSQRKQGWLRRGATAR